MIVVVVRMTMVKVVMIEVVRKGKRRKGGRLWGKSREKGKKRQKEGMLKPSRRRGISFLLALMRTCLFWVLFSVRVGGRD